VHVRGNCNNWHLIKLKKEIGKRHNIKCSSVKKLGTCFLLDHPVSSIEPSQWSAMYTSRFPRRTWKPPRACLRQSSVWLMSAHNPPPADEYDESWHRRRPQPVSQQINWLIICITVRPSRSHYGSCSSVRLSVPNSKPKPSKIQKWCNVIKTKVTGVSIFILKV